MPILCLGFGAMSPHFLVVGITKTYKLDKNKVGECTIGWCCTILVWTYTLQKSEISDSNQNLNHMCAYAAICFYYCDEILLECWVEDFVH